MPDYLLIRAQSAAAAVDVLAVAAEIIEKMGDDAQVDIATSEEYADYLRLSEVVRRVVGVTAPDIAALTSPPDNAGGGLGGKLLSLGKKVASVAGQNARQYWELAKDLRLVRYDVVFDFDSSAFSAAVSRAAKADKTIGFDARNIDKPVTGAVLLYNETYHIRAEMSDAMRLRHLPARFFDYDVGGKADSRIVAAPPPAEETPYVAVVGEVPPPFADVLRETNQRLVVRHKQTESAQETAAVVQHADIVVGNGVAAAIAAACGVRTFFIGGKRHVPEGAVWCSTPAALVAACSSHLSSSAKTSPAADDEPSPPPQRQDETKPAESELLTKLKTEKE